MLPAIFARGSTDARSRCTNETSASGSAAFAVSAPGCGVSASASIFCGLNGGMPADNSVTAIARFEDTRTNGRTRTTSRLPERLVIETRMTWRAELVSPAGGRRSALRGPDDRSAIAPRNAPSARSGMAAKCASPSSDVNTAPPISAAPQRPVRIVPENHWAETRRRSTVMPVPPSTDSGGSLPRSMRSISPLGRNAARLPVSNSPSPCRRAHQTSGAPTRYDWSSGRVPTRPDRNTRRRHDAVLPKTRQSASIFASYDPERRAQAREHSPQNPAARPRNVA